MLASNLWCGNSLQGVVSGRSLALLPTWRDWDVQLLPEGNAQATLTGNMYPE